MIQKTKDRATLKIGGELQCARSNSDTRLEISLYYFESRSGEVYFIYHYVIKFISDLWQVSGFSPCTSPRYIDCISWMGSKFTQCDVNKWDDHFHEESLYIHNNVSI